MIENLKATGRLRSLHTSPNNIKQQGEDLQTAVNEIRTGLEDKLTAKFGRDFKDIYDAFCSRFESYYGKLLIEGQNLINQAEGKGFPLPKSKIGLRMFAAATGAIGIATPVIGFPIMAMSIVLWKLSDKEKAITMPRPARLYE